MAAIRLPPYRAEPEAELTNGDNVNALWCRRRISYVGFVFAFMILPFCASNIFLALQSIGATEWGFSENDQPQAMSELQVMLDLSQQQVAKLEGQLQRIQALSSKADVLAQELDQAKAKLSVPDEAKIAVAKLRGKEQVKADKEKRKKLKNQLEIQKAMKEEEENNKLKHATKEEKKPTETSKKAKKRKDSRPNILLLYADDWRYDTLGIANDVVKTPHLDQLAREGVRFTENCVTTSVCWASRATLLTGLYLARHKTNMPSAWYGNWTESIYHLILVAGYYVGHVGKWGIWKLPHDKGLDYETEDEGWHYKTIGDKLWHITEKNEHDALEFLATRDETKPFFLNVAFYATHAVDADPQQYLPQNASMSLYVNDSIPVPITATDEEWRKMPYFFSDSNEGRVRWRDRYETPDKHQSMMKNYYRMATEVDTACGSIIKELKNQGELDNTVIIFTTDNGNFHAEHGLADKWYPHQESIRVPLIIRDPRMPSSMAGTLNDEFTLNLDLAPTILMAAGITPPRTMMGRDISDLYLKKDTKWRKEFYYEHPYHLEKDYIPGSEALVRKDYKYFLWRDYEFEQFFDMKNDPLEQYDIINSRDKTHRKVLREMKERFQIFRKLVHSNKTITL